MKIDSPKISVIVPTFNRADKLRACLNSLANQVFKDFEVLVCDDGSIDDTADVVCSFSGRLDILYLYFVIKIIKYIQFFIQFFIQFLNVNFV